MSLLSKYGLEDHDKPTPGEVVNQDSETPKKGFDENLGDDVDTAKPATFHLDPRSEGNEKETTTDDGHQTVVSQEEISKADTELSGEAEGAEVGDDKVVTETDVEADTDLVNADAAAATKGEQKPGSGDTVNLLPKDVAGENTTLTNDHTLTDVYASRQQFDQMSTGIEAYIALAKDALETDGGLSTQTARALAIGLEAMDASFAAPLADLGTEAFEGGEREVATIKTITRLEDHLATVKTARDNADALLRQYAQ